MATIADARGGIQSPQFSWSWEIEILGLAGALQDITLYAKTVSIPESANEVYVRDYKNSKTHFASRDASGHTATLTFMDDENMTIMKFFDDWQTLIRNEITGSGVSRDLYAADLVIRLQRSDGETASGEIRLGHCFPTNIGEVTLDYSNSEAVELTVTMNFDEKVVTKA